MEIRPTFFSITGFLIPGIVFVTAISLECATSQSWLLRQIEQQAKTTGDNTAAGVVITVTVIAIVLSVCFVVGSVITELFQRLYKLGRERRFLYKILGLKTKHDTDKIKAAENINERTKAIAEKLLEKTTLQQLFKNDLDAREIFAYRQTCGLDLHWFAGRNLMLGGSGLSCVLAGIIALCQYFQTCRCVFFGVGAAMIVFGIVAMWIAAYRKARFEEYAAKVAAVALLSSNSKALTREDSP
jgi:hypothetical protein